MLGWQETAMVMLFCFFYFWSKGAMKPDTIKPKKKKKKLVGYKKCMIFLLITEASLGRYNTLLRWIFVVLLGSLLSLR